MKTIIKTAIVAFAVVAGAGAGQAQAQTVWQFPYKGAPYATQVDPAQKAAPVRAVRKAKHSAAHVRMAGTTHVIR